MPKPNTTPNLIPLERLLRAQGFGSRRDCRSMVRKRRVTVMGQAGDNPYLEIDPSVVDFCFTVDGTEWQWHETATVLMNKPAGHECSRNPIHHPSVLELLPAPLRERGVQPVGRLDEDTTGLLILTDDGQLNHRLSSPKHKLPKVYLAQCRHDLTEEMLKQLLAGVQLHDEPLPICAAGAEAIGPRTLRLTLREGKYHQVKRMVAAVENRVDGLQRVSFGALTLPDDLLPGQWRWLNAEEVARLETAA